MQLQLDPKKLPTSHLDTSGVGMQTV